MLTGRQIHGLQVVNATNKRELGRISDIVADSASGRISGYIVSGNRLLARNYFLPAESVLSIDLSGAKVPDISSFLPMSAAYGGERQLQRRGQRLHGHDGQDRGTVADLIVDQGYIRGVELSQGIIGDLRQRRQFLPWEGLQAGATMPEDNMNLE